MSETLTLTIAVMVCLQIKHFAADYLFQPMWLIKGKGHFDQPGGYVHAAIHAVLSIPALLLAGSGALVIAVIISVEFVVHFIIDHLKAVISIRNGKGPATGVYWALHGADQLAHHLTYATMVAVALTLSGAA